MTHRTLFPPQDENRALEQLERFHREILRARRERDRASTEFEGFVQEMGERPAPTAPEERASRRVARPIAAATQRAAAERTGKPAAEAVATKPTTLRPSESPAEPIPALLAPRRSYWGFLAVAVGLLLGASATFYFSQRSSQPDTNQQPPSTAAPPATNAQQQPAPLPPAQGAAGRAAPAPVPPAVSPSTVRLTTDRAVWLRVIVDGQKVLERELPPGQTLTYNPTTLIVIRAGDAGGVRVRVGNGPEQVLGRDAFPATRRFEVPKP